MRQEIFERQHNSDWRALKGLLEHLEHPKGSASPPAAALSALPRSYRRVCHHYALARSRGYSPALVDELHDLVLRGHQQLYRHPGRWTSRVLRFFGRDFPRSVRAHKRYMGVSGALFLLPGALLAVLCYADADLIYSVLSADQVAETEAVYDPGSRRPGRSAGRDSDTDLAMFGYYVQNNISIGFRTFAAGILLGVGTLLILIFNGVVIGSVAGHLTRLGYLDTFWPFVVGHGALELTAIVICGAAGLMLGRAVLAPGQETRAQALRGMAREAAKLVLGAAVMLLLAALVEAFWSSSAVSIQAKYGVAAALWLMVFLYLAVAGGGPRGPC